MASPVIGTTSPEPALAEWLRTAHPLEALASHAVLATHGVSILSDVTVPVPVREAITFLTGVAGP